MEKEKFESMLNNITSIVEEVDDKRKYINSVSLSSLKQEELEILYKKSTELQSKIDKILKAEFYHIITMGKLSSSQATKLIRNIKNLGEAEDINKRNITCFENLKSIYSALSNSSTYKLKELSNITLR